MALLTNEVLLRLDRATFEHAYLDDGVTGRSSGRVVEAFGFEREETVRSFVLRKRERIHYARVDHIGELCLDRVEVFFNAVDFDLSPRLCPFIVLG